MTSHSAEPIRNFLQTNDRPPASRRAPRRRTSGDRMLVFSLCMSLFLHGLAYAAYRQYLKRKPARQPFIMLMVGEEAFTLVGGPAHTTPSPAAPAREKADVPEERLETEAFLPPRETEEEEKTKPPLALPEVDSAALFLTHRLEEEKPEMPPEQKQVPLKKRQPEKKEREKESPSPAPRQPTAASPAQTSGGAARPRGVRKNATVSSGGFALLYPESARLLGETGTAVIAATIDAAGRCMRTVVLETSGRPVLDQAALDAVRSASYHPATIDGEPVATEERFEIAFELVD